MIEIVRISAPAKDQLIALKRRTGLKHWNELGRWALCRSLAEPSRPPVVPIHTEGGLEIDWRTFTGRLADLYTDLICQRCILDGLPADQATVRDQLSLHLHRGIGYLAGDPGLGRAAQGSRQRRGLGIRELVAKGVNA